METENTVGLKEKYSRTDLPLLGSDAAGANHCSLRVSRAGIAVLAGRLCSDRSRHADHYRSIPVYALSPLLPG